MKWLNSDNIAFNLSTDSKYFGADLLIFYQCKNDDLGSQSWAMDSDEQPLAPASSPATGLPSSTTVTPSTSGATSETEDGVTKTFEADRIFVLMQKDYRFV